MGWLSSRNALPRPPSTLHGAAARAPAQAGRGVGGAAREAPGEWSRASGRRRSGPRSLDGFRAAAGPRGPVARGRAGWRRRAPSCAARLASAILDAAAAAASASSSVFAVRCWFPRPERRGGETGACGRKRKKGVESVGDGARGQKAERSGADASRRRGPAPPPPVRPPRQRLCSPDRRSARPGGHASRPLREPFPASACPSPPAPASRRPGPPSRGCAATSV